jgi:hypothetical protein
MSKTYRRNERKTRVKESKNRWTFRKFHGEWFTWEMVTTR